MGSNEGLEIGEGAFESVFERGVRFPVQELAGQADIRLALAGVVLGQGPVYEFGT
jgi:hypothetical protein